MRTTSGNAGGFEDLRFTLPIGGKGSFRISAAFTRLELPANLPYPHIGAEFYLCHPPLHFDIAALSRIGQESDGFIDALARLVVRITVYGYRSSYFYEMSAIVFMKRGRVLTFPDPEPVYLNGPGVVQFFAGAGRERICCHISTQALEDDLNAQDNNYLETYLENMAVIHERAYDIYSSYGPNANGVVLIRSGDI